MNLEYNLLLGEYPNVTSTEATTTPSSIELPIEPIQLIGLDPLNALTSESAKSFFDKFKQAFDNDPLFESADISTFSDFKTSFIQKLDIALEDALLSYDKTISWSILSTLGISCLNLFIQLNYTGPSVNFDSADLLPDSWSQLFSLSNPNNLKKKSVFSGTSTSDQQLDSQISKVIIGNFELTNRDLFDRWILESLQVSGEPAYVLTSNPLLLYLSLYFLVRAVRDKNSGPQTSNLEDWLNLASSEPLLSQRNSTFPTASWWGLRALKITQDILDNPSDKLFEYVESGFLALKSSFVDNIYQNNLNENLPKSTLNKIIVSFYLEMALMYQHYHKNSKAQEYLKMSQDASGLLWHITGAMGKRTKFQERNVAQLLLVAKSSEDSEDINLSEMNIESSINKAPAALDLNDDTLLEKIEYVKNDSQNLPESLACLNIDPLNQQNLKTIDQCILLGFCLEVKNENPNHGLTTEQMIPFVLRILENPNNWSIQTAALLQRSRLETEKTRTIQRSVLQLEALVDQTENSLQDEAGPYERLSYFHLLALPNKWDMKKELAHRYMSIGAIKSGLDIFESLYMWDETVACYQILEKTNIAEDIVNRQLQANPQDPKLWCILGDLKQSPEHWEKAWEISGQRFTRAMRSLGGYYFQHKQMDKCIEAYKKALALNTLYDGSWYNMGCAALHVEDWDLSIKAFRNVVNIDTENAEAWNNLASYKYDSWQIWSNFLLTSVAIGQFASAIQSIQRIVELRADKEKSACIDTDILGIIVQSVTREQPGVSLTSEQRSSQRKSRLKVLVEALLVNVISTKITDSPKIWRISADFWFWKKDYKTCLECYEKAYRCVSMKPEVCYALPPFKDAVYRLTELVDMYKNLGPMPVISSDESTKTNEITLPTYKIKSKMAIQGLMSKTRSHFESTPEFASLEALLEDIKSL
ncbi:hypothetical protein BB561_001519 [Smittium simulii]|uniref:Uncharacterized protein n=1 Tax=Smittium simulii TaxID=133385 RepID=A0A2T9YU81_9FUNG|nr:hypothetical protein BB561_001519 [Smittium simulii]